MGCLTENKALGEDCQEIKILHLLYATESCHGRDHAQKENEDKLRVSESVLQSPRVKTIFVSSTKNLHTYRPFKAIWKGHC